MKEFAEMNGTGAENIAYLEKKLDSDWKNVKIKYIFDYVRGNNDRSSSSKLANHGHKPAPYPFTKFMGTRPSE